MSMQQVQMVIIDLEDGSRGTIDWVIARWPIGIAVDCISVFLFGPGYFANGGRQVRIVDAVPSGRYLPEAAPALEN